RPPRPGLPDRPYGPAPAADDRCRAPAAPRGAGSSVLPRSVRPAPDPGAEPGALLVRRNGNRPVLARAADLRGRDALAPAPAGDVPGCWTAVLDPRDPALAHGDVVAALVHPGLSLLRHASLRRALGVPHLLRSGGLPALLRHRWAGDLGARRSDPGRCP